MAQRPMYMLKFNKPKFSKKFEERKKKEESNWQSGAMKVINRLLDDGETLRKNRNLEGCLTMCNRLRRYC